MIVDFEARIRAIIDPLPDEFLLPVSCLRQELASLVASVPDPHDTRPDHTVKQLAERFDRSDSCVRGWCRTGKLKAYKFNDREYRVTPSALAEFEERMRGRRPAEPAQPVALDAWRRA